MTVPDFLVIGAYKSGTTALHHYLRSHPALFVPDRKEPNHYAFAGDVPPFEHPAASGSVRDPKVYSALFANASPGRLMGEVSPAYLAVPVACDRIHRAAPQVRLIAVLRNPVARAYSDYLMYRRDAVEPEGSFVRALEQQSQRDPATDPTSRYISTGFYGAQLARYLAAFPREQIHVLLHEDLRDARRDSLSAVFHFLGVDHALDIEEQAPSNVSGEPGGLGMRLAYGARRRARVLRPIVPESVRRRMDGQLERRLVRTPMPPEAAGMLIDIYRDDVRQLSELIDRDLSSWLQP